MIRFSNEAKSKPALFKKCWLKKFHVWIVEMRHLTVQFGQDRQSYFTKGVSSGLYHHIFQPQGKQARVNPAEGSQRQFLMLVGVVRRFLVLSESAIPLYFIFLLDHWSLFAGTSMVCHLERFVHRCEMSR